MFPFVLLEVNWSNISSNWVDYILTGYTNIFGTWVYPLCFLGIIGYIYCLQRSAVVAAAAICITFSVFGITGVFAGAEQFSFLNWLIVIVSFAGLFTVLFTQKKR